MLLQLFKDGDSFVCTQMNGFVNIQENKAGTGKFPEEAIRDYFKDEMLEIHKPDDISNIPPRLACEKLEMRKESRSKRLLAIIYAKQARLIWLYLLNSLYLELLIIHMNWLQGYLKKNY